MNLLFFFSITTLMLLFQTTTVLGLDSHDNTPSLDENDVTSVAFNNRLPHNANFTIHCSSPDHDTGTRIIASSHYYEFSFEVNFFQTTYYFCNLRWRDVEAAFYAYRASRDVGRCRHYCLWNVKEEGVEGFPEDDATQPDIIVPWK